MRNFLPLVVVIAVVLLVGGFYYTQSKSKVGGDSAQLPSSKTDTNNNAAGTNETAGWNTYVDSSLGIKFKYPSNWQYRVVGSGSNSAVQIFSPETWAIAQMGDRGGMTNFMSFQFMETDESVKNMQGRNVTISGVDALDTGWAVRSAAGSPVRQVRFFLNPVLVVQMNALSEMQNIEETILSSLEFI